MSLLSDFIWKVWVMSPVPLQHPPPPPTPPSSATRRHGNVCPHCPPMARPYVTWPTSGPAHHGVTEPLTFLLSLWVNAEIFKLFLTFSGQNPPFAGGPYGPFCSVHDGMIWAGPEFWTRPTVWRSQAAKQTRCFPLRSRMLCVNSSYSSGVRSPRLVLKISFFQSRKLPHVSLWSKQLTTISQGRQQTEQLVCLESFL